MNDGYMKFSGKRNFGYLDDLIHSGDRNIVLDSNIILGPDEWSKYGEGINIDEDNIIVDGGHHVIDTCGRARIFNITGKNVVLKNLLIKGGFSDGNGGAINIGNADVSLINIVFLDNRSYNDGGAICSRGSLLNVFDCKFYLNQSTRGGAIYINDCEAYVSKCNLSFNFADKNGGAIRCYSSDLEIVGCEFSENKSGYGGAVHDLDSEIRVIGSSFFRNDALHDGSAILKYKAGLRIKDSKFYGNHSSIGSVIRCRWTTLEVCGCRLSDNKSFYGDAIDISDGELLLKDSILSHNVASHGCAIYRGESVIIDSTFAYNHLGESYGSGGAIFNWGSLEICDSSFLYNTSKGRGAAIYNVGHSKIGNCIVFHNVANADGAAIFSTRDNDTVVSDCIFEKNEPRDIGKEE